MEQDQFASVTPLATFGFFNPKAMSISVSSRIPYSLTKYFSGSINEHLKEIQRDFPSLDLKQQLTLMELATVNLHEAKHFHDFVGTTFGVKYAKERLLAEMMLCKTLQDISSKGIIKVPLVRWKETGDCPSPLVDALDLLRQFSSMQYVEFYRQSIDMGDNQVPGLLMLQRLPNVRKLVSGSPDEDYQMPMVHFDDDNCLQKGRRNQCYPVNTLSLLESNALNSQLEQIRISFGKLPSKTFLKYYRDKIGTSNLWVYSVNTLLAAICFGQCGLSPSMNNIFQVHDWALMGDYSSKCIMEQPPGHRYAGFLAFLNNKYSGKKLADGDLTALLEDFSYNYLNGEESPRIRIERELKASEALAIIGRMEKKTEQIIDKLGRIMGVDKKDLVPLIKSVPQAAYTKIEELHQKIWRLRLDRPELFENPIEYISNFDKFPPPPTFITYDSELVNVPYGLIDSLGNTRFIDLPYLEHSRFWILYSIVSAILDQVTNSGVIVCPLKEALFSCAISSEECGIVVPGNKINKKQDCVFGSALQLMNLDRLDILAME